MASNWSVTFRHPDTGAETTWDAPRPLRTDEVVAVSRHLFKGRDADILRKDPYPGTTRQFQEVLAGKPTAAPERWSSRAEGWQERLKADAPEIAGFVAGTAVGMGAPSLLTRLGTAAVTRGVLPNLPRLGQFLNLTGSGTAAGVTQPLVAGRPEDIESGAYWGTALGGLGGAVASLKGALSRAFPGHAKRAGRVMAKDVGAVAGSQVPAMQGLESSEQLIDWTRRAAGQRSMGQMYSQGAAPVKGVLPPTATRAGFAPAMHAWEAYQTRAATLASQGSTPQMVAQLLGPPPPMPGLFVPAISRAPLSLEDALEILSTRGKAFEQAANARGVQVTRRSWMEGWDQVYNELRRYRVPNDILDAFTKMRAQYAVGKGYQKLLGKGTSEEAVPTTHGVLDPTKLQLQTGKQIGQLERRFKEAKSPDELNRLLDVVYRGYKDPKTGTYPVGSVTKTDQPGEGLLGFLRYYLTSTKTGGTTARAGVIPPRGVPWPYYVAAKNRLPLEIKPENRALINRIMQLSRGGVQVESGE